MERFPVFNSHEEAKCFRCGALLDSPPEDSGHEEGRWQRKCKCGRFSFYDLKASGLPAQRPASKPVQQSLF